MSKKSRSNFYFVSWSGGKDSALALFRVMKKYGKPRYLLTMLTEEGNRSRSHGIAKEVLQKQAELLQIPIVFYSASWNDYEKVFLNALQNFKKEGIEIGVFGDLKIPDKADYMSHRRWADQICEKAGMKAVQPLWDDSIESLLNEFFTCGFAAKIISIKAELLNENYLGKILSKKEIIEFSQLKINTAGENGEYHTIVIDGPIFSHPLYLTHGIKVLKSGYWFLDVQ